MRRKEWDPSLAVVSWWAEGRGSQGLGSTWPRPFLRRTALQLSVIQQSPSVSFTADVAGSSHPEEA
jgi:hypothetical protein